MSEARSTIAAIASPPGAGRRGVVRVSGPEARGVARATCGVELGPRGMVEARFHDGVGTQPCLLLWMPGPGSYTGEDVLELHLPGSPYLLRAAFERVLGTGVELAEPGEFTRRAFLEGRMDLTRAEGVLELVAARTRSERRAATALLVGGLEERTADLRERFEVLRALCEASLDFDEGDEIDVPVAQLEELAGELSVRLEEALRWERERARDHGVPRVVLLGDPNAGKSCLFNRLVGDEGQRAIVSDLAGTTRDSLRGLCEVEGVLFEVVDVAGVDRAARGVDEAAQGVAERERRGADLVVWVVDGSVGRVEGGEVGEGVRVWNKCDVAPGVPPGWIGVSALSGEGVGELGKAVVEGLANAGDGAGAGRALAARHERSLAMGREVLEEARAALAAGEVLDLVAERLREATGALDGIAGRTTAEDLLDKVFARFCLGK